MEISQSDTNLILNYGAWDKNIPKATAQTQVSPDDTDVVVVRWYDYLKSPSVLTTSFNISEVTNYTFADGDEAKTVIDTMIQTPPAGARNQQITTAFLF
jgi:hypothetical protein